MYRDVVFPHDVAVLMTLCFTEILKFLQKTFNEVRHNIDNLHMVAIYVAHSTDEDLVCLKHILVNSLRALPIVSVQHVVVFKTQKPSSQKYFLSDIFI